MRSLYRLGFLLVLLSSPRLLQAGGLLQETSADTNKIAAVTYPPLTEREGKGLEVPRPPAEHPRLLFRKGDIPALKAKTQYPLMKGCWEKIQSSAEFSTDGLLKIDGSKKQNLDNSIRDAIEARALLYAFSGDRAMGRSAVDALMNFYRTLKIDMSKHDICRVVGRSIVTGALVYDWCYDLLTPDEKNILIGRMETLAVTGLEVEWPALTQGSVTGHGSEAQLARDMLSCGIATFDEKPEIYDRVAGRIMAEFVPARKYFYPASYHHQGSSYGGYRFTWDMWATFLFDRMGYPNIFGDAQATVPYRFIYMRRPDGQLMRDGDDYIEGQHPFGAYWQTGGDALAGSYFNDPFLIGEAVRQGRVGKGADYLFDFLMFDSRISPDMDKSDLPLTRYFKEPLGAMIARTGWEEGIAAPTVVAEMKLGAQNFANHQHLDAGTFQLYYKGPLATESGIYEGGKGAYGSDHFKNYYQRTIAHNAILVYDPNEKFRWQGRDVANDGGQQYPGVGEPRNLDTFLQNDYRMAEVLAQGFGPDSLRPEYSYLKGELAEAYGDKIRSLQRSFVFLNFFDKEVPAALIVFDRVENSSKDFRKYWLLHCVEDPLIKGNTTTISRGEKGYRGKMINTTLLPSQDNLVIEKVGGPGKQFSVFGTQYDQTFRNPGRNSADSAMWRIEVSPKTPAVTDHFLNVMQVMDNDAKISGLEVTSIRAGNFGGVVIGDRIVLFNRDKGQNNAPVKIKVPPKKKYKVLLLDMGQGYWKVESRSSKTNSVRVVENEGGLLYFDASGGTYGVSVVSRE